MEKPCDIHDNIYTLATILHSHVCEAENLINSLQQSAHQLARGQTVEGITKSEHEIQSEPVELDTDVDEDALIYELEKARLNLVMEIQEENFISQKLKGMVGECEDLVGGVTSYYSSFQKSKLREGLDLDAYVKTFSNTAVADTMDLLRTNTSKMKQSQSSLYDSALKALETIESEEARLLAPEYQRLLSRTVDLLNEKYNLLAEKSV